MDDQQAIERYRYLLRTAPPGDIERAHEEAFAQLSAEQRAAVLQQLATQVPPSEISGDDPKSLARTATRAEMRAPGTMERTFGSAGVPGLGSMFLSTLAGAFVGSAIGNAMFGDAGSEVGDAGSDVGDAGSDVGDAGEASDVGDSGDAGFDSGGFDGGGFDGGDFGGGDFGGGFG